MNLLEKDLNTEKKKKRIQLSQKKKTADFFLKFLKQQRMEVYDFTKNVTMIFLFVSEAFSLSFGDTSGKI